MPAAAVASRTPASAGMSGTILGASGETVVVMAGCPGLVRASCIYGNGKVPIISARLPEAAAAVAPAAPVAAAVAAIAATPRAEFPPGARPPDGRGDRSWPASAAGRRIRSERVVRHRPRTTPWPFL